MNLSFVPVQVHNFLNALKVYQIFFRDSPFNPFWVHWVARRFLMEACGCGPRFSCILFGRKDPDRCVWVEVVLSSVGAIVLCHRRHWPEVLHLCISFCQRVVKASNRGHCGTAFQPQHSPRIAFHYRCSHAALPLTPPDTELWHHCLADS